MTRQATATLAALLLTTAACERAKPVHRVIVTDLKGNPLKLSEAEKAAAAVCYGDGDGGSVYVKPSGHVGFELGNGVTIDTKGRTSIDLGGGMHLRSDGTLSTGFDL